MHSLHHWNIKKKGNKGCSESELWKLRQMNVRINICITKLYEYSNFEIVFILQQSEKLQIFSVFGQCNPGPSPKIVLNYSEELYRWSMSRFPKSVARKMLVKDIRKNLNHLQILESSESHFLDKWCILSNFVFSSKQSVCQLAIPPLSDTGIN